MDNKKDFLTACAGTLAIAVAVPAVLYKIIKFLYYRNALEVFQDKVVVITGASSGIGEALAHEFYQHGCRVVLCARRQTELERVRSDLLRMYSTIPTHPPVVVSLDLSDLNSLEGTVDKIIEITGRIDYLINNGGISNRGSVVDTQNDVFLRVMMVNYFGTVALTKAVLPHMINNKKGHVVFMNSIQGLIAIPNRSAYSASKHALKAFSDSLRAEVASKNISITMINPGYVNTSMSLNALTESGKAHGKMDASTLAGYSASYVAKQTALAVAHKQNEMVLAPFFHKLAIMLRTNLPSLFFTIMQYRAKQAN